MNCEGNILIFKTIESRRHVYENTYALHMRKNSALLVEQNNYPNFKTAPSLEVKNIYTKLWTAPSLAKQILTQIEDSALSV